MFESSVAIPQCSGEEGRRATLRLLFSFYFLASPGIELRSGSLCDKYFHPPSDLTRQKSHAFSTMRTMVDGHRGKEQQQPRSHLKCNNFHYPCFCSGVSSEDQTIFWKTAAPVLNIRGRFPMYRCIILYVIIMNYYIAV